VELFVGRGGLHRLGFILLHPYGLAGSPYVASIAVSAGARSRGVGTQLMVFAEQRFAHRRHLFLCVSSFNRRAQRFYRRLGYKRVAEFADYIVDGHSELLMHKKLS
jgi:ribosomal protein S18 acetylase RimI-like enzyme